VGLVAAGATLAVWGVGILGMAVRRGPPGVFMSPTINGKDHDALQSRRGIGARWMMKLDRGEATTGRPTTHSGIPPIARQSRELDACFAMSIGYSNET
jgi:hypothetical protein